MKKRSRFLQVPIEPFTVDPEVRADELLQKMERISFQGRSLGVAHRVWQKMLGDDVTIFMGMAGALSAGGLRMVVAYLIEHRYIDCLVSTGANLYHDLHETRGRHHYLGSAHVNDAALAKKMSPVEASARLLGHIAAAWDAAHPAGVSKRGEAEDSQGLGRGGPRTP